MDTLSTVGQRHDRRTAVVFEDDRAADVGDLLAFGQREHEVAQCLGVLDRDVSEEVGGTGHTMNIASVSGRPLT